MASHGLSAVEEIPAAVHLNLHSVKEDGGNPSASTAKISDYAGRVIVSSNDNDGYGGGQAHNNVTPAKAVYAWLRTA